MIDRIVGFTGSRAGITDAQKRIVTKMLGMIRPVEAHHGECVGADAMFHEIVREALPECHIIGHPPLYNSTLWARLAGYYREEDPLPYLERDRSIVEACGILIGCPKIGRRFTNLVDRATSKYGNQYRSGTWYTINYALKMGKEVVIVNPDGTIDRTEAKK